MPFEKPCGNPERQQLHNPYLCDYGKIIKDD